VERLLGPSSHECRCIYDSNGDFIRVEYAKAPCKGDPSGWNVSAEIVLSIRVRPAAPQKVSELQFNKSEFQKAVSDTGTTYYSNRLQGVEYEVSWDRELLVSGLHYFPSTEDSHLRC